MTAGTLLTLPLLAQARRVAAPALIVVGEVVALLETLACADASSGAFFAQGGR